MIAFVADVNDQVGPGLPHAAVADRILTSYNALYQAGVEVLHTCVELGYPGWTTLGVYASL